MMLDTETIRTGTCYHEAAHAVFDHHNGFITRRVYVTERLEAMCVTAVPVEPYPWQAFALACGLLAGEYAVHRRRGWSPRTLPFEEFVAEAEELRDLREWGDPEGEGDIGRCLEMLRIAETLGIYGSLEDCYRMACESAVRNVEVWWEEIVAVAERLKETGYLDGAEVALTIESAWTDHRQDDIKTKAEK